MENYELEELLGLSKFNEIPKKTGYINPDNTIDYYDDRYNFALRNKHNYKYLITRPNDCPHGAIMITSAPKGMGKTTMFEINELEGTVCVITPRKCIAKKMANDVNVDMVYYLKDDDSSKSPAELREARNVSIVNLSTWKLGGAAAVKGYGNLIVDEYELVLEQSVSNNASKPQDCEDVFKSLHILSDRVFALGWLFTNYSIDYLQRFGKKVIFDFWHRDIASHIQLNLYPNREQFFENLNEVAKSERVLLFTDRSEKGIKKTIENINHDVDYFWANKRPDDEQQKAYANPEENGMRSQVEVHSPYCSHGYNFRNETPRTMMLLENTGSGRLDITTIVQFMFRNRDQQIIDLYMWTPETEKTLEQLEQIATTPAQFPSEKIRIFGKYNEALHKKVINPEDEIIKRRQWYQNKARIETGCPTKTLFLYLGYLGLTNINHIPPLDELPSMVGTGTNIDNILNFGKLLKPAEYSEGTIDERRYTDICKALDLEELTYKDVARYDGGDFKENEKRNRQMFADKTVRTFANQQKGIFAENSRFGFHQYYLGQFMKELKHITNAEFKQSDWWRNALKYEYHFNQTMLNEGYQEFCITPDDKARPLSWLKRFLTKHNFYCVIQRPDKSEKTALRKLAEKSCKKE